jgi:cytochrome c-type biogenesis protein CcmH
LFRQIRCLVCQNESIDDSDAPLAADLRALVRADLAAGRSDADITRALVDRYGEFVLLKPTASVGNAPLWLLPFLLAAGGLAAFAVRARHVAPATEPPLTDAERARVSALAAAATVPPPPRPTDTTAAV